MLDILSRLREREALSRLQMREVMTRIMSGQVQPGQIKEFLLLLNEKGFSVEEVTGAVEVMRQFVVPVRPAASLVFDVVGTGGDGKHTLNVSTISALVVAASGVTVAKHGNRSVSSRCGSADVLEALGVNLLFAPDRIAGCLDKVGVAFLFAQVHHPAMKEVAAVRKELGVKTIFNILGPLTNPAGATHQLIGVYAPFLSGMVTQVLANLGLRRVIAVHGADGLDEITTTAGTSITEWRDGRIIEENITPEEFGLSRARESDLTGGDVRENAGIVMDILSGVQGPMRDIVLINSAYALYAAEQVTNPHDGIVLAARLIDSGAALSKLEQLKEFTNRAC